MALLNATSLLGIVLLSYLSSFVLFAILRIATGVSIQRIGYLSLRHISYTPKDGVRIDVRGLGLSLHRPNFAQPTWISLQLTELKVTLNPALSGGSRNISAGSLRDGDMNVHVDASSPDKPLLSLNMNDEVYTSDRSRLWNRLTNVKEKIKRIHRKIHWLKMLDVVALNTTVDVVGVGHVQVGTLTMAVDTRRRVANRGRLFRHKKDPSGDQRPAEWIFSAKNLLLGVAGKEPVEVLDAMAINIHGILYKELEGLRDTSISVKAGRLHIPYDDLVAFSHRMKAISAAAEEPRSPDSLDEMTFSAVVEELDRPGSREASIVQTVADSKEFLSSILRNVHEIQLALSFIRVSKEMELLPHSVGPVVLNVVTHEVGFDLHRLDQRSPAHRMYFSSQDTAHQALLAAISISVSLDDDDSNTNKIMYIPMATTTIKTTLPAKTMSFTEERDATERNANILFANLVVTSPSIDLEPRQLIQILEVLKRSRKPSTSSAKSNHRLISRLLPKASIKLSIHEPVVRFVLPVGDSATTNPDEYDMIISAISSVSLDLESSHSAAGELLYSLASNFRISSHQLYFQAASGVRHNLVITEALELKVQLSATTEVCVTASGSLRTFSILMVKEEVTTGVYNIVKHFKRKVEPEKLRTTPEANPQSFLRKLPPWLLEYHFEGSDCSIEVAGIDKGISKQTRGLALQLESWTTDYHSHRKGENRRVSASRRKPSMTSRTDDPILFVENISPSKKHPQSPSDGRRLALHIRGFEGFIIESFDHWESEPFLSLPRFEIAFSTSRDLQGPIFHINSATKALYLYVSLYRFYSIGVALSILKDVSLGPRPDHSASNPEPDHDGDAGIPRIDHHARTPSPPGVELITIDIKASLVQIKANLPADPPMLLQIYEVAAGWHRWSAPFLRSHLLRLHAEAPHIKHVWARLASMNNIRLDFRQHNQKVGSSITSQRSIDIAADFIRLAVPHGLTMYRVFDNVVNTMKAITQLHHRFKFRTNEYILNKVPEGPKHVPRVSLRSKALMFELEDDAFEWKLNAIYHVGIIEQKQRLARAAAFRVKLKNMNMDEERSGRSSSRYGVQSTQPASENRPVSRERQRSRSQDSHRRKRSRSRGRHSQKAKMRYDPEGVCSITRSAKVKADEAMRKLQEHNARSWKRRIDGVLALQTSSTRNVRQMFSGADETPNYVEETEAILAIPDRPGLMSTVISDLHLVVDKPSFPLSECPQFLHEIGKGMPFDMQYALLIPTSISLDMGEARVMLRDYPLNLLHVPAIRPGQPARLPSWSLRTDFVIAEEYRNDESIRHVKVDIVPKGKLDENGDEVPGFSVDVRRTVSPVKTYSKPTIDINTTMPTTISWGTSYQPVIQDMMMIIEGFTKPEIDPSDRVGFWDKIRLSFHSRLTVNWKGDGDVHLRLKGSRDPYVVTGYGAGFVMCWRSDVQWAVHTGDDPKKFMTVTSGEYVLAVPDYSHQARRLPEHAHRDTESMSSDSSQKNATEFKKVIMKLSGNVQWLAGLVFEHNKDDGGRSFDFRHHYDVVLKNPKNLQKSQLEESSLPLDYDAFRGFRSHHIHLSIAVAAPFDRDWNLNNTKPSNSYNTVHLSPRFFTHFFDWWSLFSGVMSLPIRQGNLWRGPEKTSKKFGRHLGTIKYNLLLSPLFIAHIYKHKDAEDYMEDVLSATGLKLRLDSFVLDLHQRREYFDTMGKAKSKQTRTSEMKINRAELDFISADLRAVSASIGGTTADDLVRATDEILSSYQDPSPKVDMARFTIPDRDFSWIDMDDFVELDWVLPAESNPETKILPLAFTPRFTYFRQTDHKGTINGDASRTSSFGEEPTHYCVLSHDNDPRKVQADLVRERLEALAEQIESHTRLMGEQELRVVRDGDQDQSHKEHFELLACQNRELLSKQKFLEGGLRRLTDFSIPDMVSDFRSDRQSSGDSSNSPLLDPNTAHEDLEGLFTSAHDEFASDFNNRFIIHNIQLKWNNSLRNIILRYSHQVGQRRGFVYYMSRRAVKFILDIVEEQGKSKKRPYEAPSEQQDQLPYSTGSPTDEKDDDTIIEDRIQQLLNDAKRFVDVDDTASAEAQSQRRPSTADLGNNITENFVAQDSYHVRLIAPQIQLQSEKNTKAVAMISAKGMQFKVICVMDKARMSDDVSGLVQRRFALDMDGAQFFVSTQKKLYQFLSLYSGNKYGNAPGSAWPPWVSLEVMFDFHLNPFGFQRVIQKTSASLRYDKYNTLRLKYNEEVAGGKEDEVHHPERPESRMDHLWVDFPRIHASCNSDQYYAMYIIVLDLLMYSEPLEKIRSERLEKIMLASDFSDLRGAPEMVINLQERIRQLEDIKLQFQVNAKYLDRQGWQDRINLEKDLANCEDELFFIMKAITTSQRKSDDRKLQSQPTGLLRWYLSASEIVWHLMRDKNEPLLEFQLGNAAYERIDNSDGSNHNAMEIEKIYGLNLLPNALYPEIIGSYQDPHNKDIEASQTQKMLQVDWYMLEAIAGIPVLETFQVSMFPLKVQLERDLGKKLFEYIFPGVGSNAFDGGNFSPLMVKNMQPIENDDDSEAEEVRNALSPDQSIESFSQEDLDSTNPASIGQRLRPTLALHNKIRSKPSGPFPIHKPKGLGISADHPFKLFKHGNTSTVSRNSNSNALVRSSSPDSIRVTARQSSERSSVNIPGKAQSEEKKKFGLPGSGKDRRIQDSKKRSDDLSQMMSRASNYMTLSKVKVNSFVICLSYKGKGDRNLEDLHDFVFRMPTLEYRNKTWSNMDLALRLKKDVIKALISHTGAIIGNKFSHHRPSKQQQSRIRELANASQIIPNSDTIVNSPSTSENNSIHSQTPNNENSKSPRASFTSGNGQSLLSRTDSLSSSIHSSSESSLKASALTPPTNFPMDPVRSSATHQMNTPMTSRPRTDLFPPQPHGRLLSSTIGRHFSSDTARARSQQRQSVDESEQENTRKKSVLLLGKKILGSIS